MSWFLTPYSSSSGSTTVAEGGSITYEISRNHFGSETVYFATFPDRGWSNSSDYFGHDDALFFGTFDTGPRYVTVTTRSDNVAGEGTEFFSVALHNGFYDRYPGTTSAFGISDATVVTTPPTVSISATPSVSEARDRSATVTISLDKQPTSQVSVEWFTAPGTASEAAGDYDGKSPTLLVWRPGDALTKTFQVPIFDNPTSTPEGNEYFYVRLQNPSSGLHLGQSSATITIIDHDASGNDVYFVDSSSAVINEAPNGGIDTVYASVNYTLPANVEILNLTGNAAISGTGNNLDNTITGNANANVLDGGTGEDLLFGAGGDDTLIGNSAGDQLYGSTGNDTYIVHHSSAGAFENASQGTDTVLADVSYAIGSHIENLTLTGNAAISGTGNNLDNAITGNAAYNTLIGNGGSDRFVFASSGTGHDTIADFNAINADAGHDFIDLSGRGLNFGALTINQAGADTQILIGADEITLKDVLKTNVEAGDFLF